MSEKNELNDLMVFEMHKDKKQKIEDEEDTQESSEQMQLTESVNTDNEDEEEQDIQEQTEQADAKPTQKSLNVPNRYLLFDELVAIVVDLDHDGTPIVEFTLADGGNDKNLPIECGICPNVMHKTKLADHLKTHEVPGTNRYACIYCDETYKDYKYLAGHARRHMGIRPYVCEPCTLYFSTKQDLRVHNQRRHHTKEHICEQCGKSFAQNTMLKRHRESTHEKKRRFQCEHCPKAYYKNFSLQEHVRAVHMGKRRMLVCPFCGMQCRDAHKMARHRKQYHLHQKQFICEICKEEFTDINYFDAHKRSIQCRNNTRRRLEEIAEDSPAEQLDGGVHGSENDADVDDDGIQIHIDPINNVEPINDHHRNDDEGTIMQQEEEEEVENTESILDHEQQQEDDAEVIVYQFDMEDDLDDGELD